MKSKSVLEVMKKLKEFENRERKHSRGQPRKKQTIHTTPDGAYLLKEDPSLTMKL